MTIRLRTMLGLLVTAGLVHSGSSRSVAEIPNRSAEQLEKAAETIVTGTLAHVYSRTERHGDYEDTHYLGEIVVDEVRRGQDVKPRDRLYVRYWRKRYLGEGNPATGHYGHRGVPHQKDRGIVYLKGNRADGYDVVSPNGFTSLTAETSAERPASRE